MVVAIHQPHYFPWLGYLAKMASVDRFILMDTVQLEKCSYMIRNRIIDSYGNIKYLTISADKHGFLDKEYREIRIKEFDIYTKKQENLILDAYKKCRYFDEVWNSISPLFKEAHELLCDVTIHSIQILRDILEISTPLVMQSDLKVDGNLKKEKLVLGLCKAAGADVYFSGRGASMQYLDVDECERAGVHVVFQDFKHPVYEQIGSHPFTAGLSTLDMLFNNGIEKSKELFWDSVNRDTFVSSCRNRNEKEVVR